MNRTLTINDMCLEIISGDEAPTEAKQTVSSSQPSSGRAMSRVTVKPLVYMWTLKVDKSQKSHIRQLVDSSEDVNLVYADPPKGVRRQAMGWFNMGPNRSEKEITLEVSTHDSWKQLE